MLTEGSWLEIFHALGLIYLFRPIDLNLDRSHRNTEKGQTEITNSTSKNYLQLIHTPFLSEYLSESVNGNSSVN